MNGPSRQPARGANPWLCIGFMFPLRSVVSLVVVWEATERPAGATAKSLASAGATVAILGRVGLQTRNSDPRTTTMTDDKIALRALLEKGSDATFLREMIGFAAQRLMELESESLCGAGHGERSAERRNQRNGYRDRDRSEERRVGKGGGRTVK